MAGLADHYGIFGVDREADEATIKKVYRKLVLQWHPDKHQDNREAAEEKIREINDAYETLSNPFKRNQYDNMIIALERKARGFRLDTTMIKPRMSIPKEFMLSPMGFPDKFVRVVGTSLFVQSRNDTKTEFYDFFKESKYSLWWLPEVNNMCRIRPQSSAGVGQDGGLNFNFALSRQVQVSEVVLSPGQMPDSAHFIAVASDVFKGAFRFECYTFPGHYLAFLPPTHLRVVGGTVDEKTAIDFMLVDYAKMFQYITVEEVLTPAVTSLGGMADFVSLDDLRQDSNVRIYFEKVQKKPIWADEDFEIFFSSRPAEWEFDIRLAKVRLRPKHEQLANSLRRAKTVAEVAASISAAGEEDVERLKIETIEAVLNSLRLPPHHLADVTTQINHLDAQKKILIVLPNVCEKQDVPFKRMIFLCDFLNTFGGPQPELKVLDWRVRCLKEMGDIISELISHKLVPVEDMTFEVLTKLAGMALDWRTCGEKLTRDAVRLCEGRSLESLLPVLKSSVKASYTSLAELVAGKLRPLLKSGAATPVAEALEVMVSGGIDLEAIPSRLQAVLARAPFDTVASIISGLGEKGIEGDDLEVCSAFLGRPSNRQSLEELPPVLLLRLTVAATKSMAVAQAALNQVASASSLVLNAFSMDDVSKLLLAVAKARCGTTGAGVKLLYERAAEVIPPKLPDLSTAQLIKVVLAVTKVDACRPLLESAAQDAIAKFSDMQPSQMMLLMQGLLPLGGDHPALQKMADNWAFSFYEATRLEGLLGPDCIPKRREDLEAKGQLTADQLSKLALAVAPVMPNHKSFWKAFGKRMREVPEDLSDAGVANLKAAFPEGSGPDFEKKEKTLKIAYKEGGGASKEQKREEARERERRREEEREKERERENRDRSRDRDRDGEGQRLCWEDRQKLKQQEEAERQQKKKEMERHRQDEKQRQWESEREREKDREQELERRKQALLEMEREKEERRKEKKAKKKKDKKEKKDKKAGSISDSSDGGVKLTGMVNRGAVEEAAKSAVATVDLGDAVDMAVELDAADVTVELDIDGTIELDEPVRKRKRKAPPAADTSTARKAANGGARAETCDVDLDKADGASSAAKPSEPPSKPAEVTKADSAKSTDVAKPDSAKSAGVLDMCDLDIDDGPVVAAKPSEPAMKPAEAAKSDSAKSAGVVDMCDLDVDDGPVASAKPSEPATKAAEDAKRSDSSKSVGVVDMCDLDLDDGPTPAAAKRSRAARKAAAAAKPPDSAKQGVVMCNLDLDDDGPVDLGD
eukprot:TRINITY_DN37661_c0_g1_i1.p1 TRINITY_DN37661_c0_g1~~TRINITY_DN37661_c0_g1_i1.p1  ORF type:complete len:1263 (-),score=351.72 TRINITY_DN37661_c0_g1_i1:122-3910(-)